MTEEAASADSPLPQLGAGLGERAGGVREAYAHEGSTALEARHARRSADEEAAFLLPHLRPGMRLLDCGCGQGSITVGLAAALAPGEVVGVDIQPHLVAAAHERARTGDVANVRFQQGDVYALPFPDATFDAVFSRALLIHLADPLRALREMRRVLKPSGVAGIRDMDFGFMVLAPSTPLLDEVLALDVRVRQHLGADPFYPRHLRRLLLEAGFARSEAGATAVSEGTAEGTRAHAVWLNERLQAPRAAAAAVEQGWTTRETLAAMAAALHAWGERPDAFFAYVLCHAIGWAAG